MSTMIPIHDKALSSLLGGGVDTEKKRKMAELVLQELQSYGRPTYPERPAMMDLDDHQLIDAYRTWETGANPGKDKMRQLGYLGTWRELIRKAEGEAGMSLLALISGSGYFTSQGKGEEAELLMGYAEDQYPFVRTEIPNCTFQELREWCLRKVRNYSLLPAYMRRMRHPKSGGGVPFHKPQGKRGGDDAGWDEDGSKPWGF